MTEKKSKNLDQLIADAEATLAARKKRQREQQRREDTALGKRLREAAVKGRDAFDTAVRKVTGELFPEDEQDDEQDAHHEQEEHHDEQPQHHQHWDADGAFRG